MPDLGKYEATVLAAYAVTIVLILGLVALSLLRARRTKRRLAVLEKRRKNRA